MVLSLRQFYSLSSCLVQLEHRTFINAAEPLLRRQSRPVPSCHGIDVLLVRLGLQAHTQTEHTGFSAAPLAEMFKILWRVRVSWACACTLTLRGTIMERGSIRLLMVTSL